MEHAVWLSGILGPVFTIMGLWILLRTDELMRMWASIKVTPAFLYFGGILNLLIGCTVLSTYHVWSLSLFVLLPIIGWVAIIRGILVLFAFDTAMKLAVLSEPYWKQLAFIPLLLGLCLSYLYLIG